MILKIDFNSTIPIYTQLKNEIILNIGNGNFKLGEQLPTVRQMASDLGINPMTVNKTYALLKQEGYIEIDRRKGVHIKQHFTKDTTYEDTLEKNLTLCMTEGRLKGFSRDEIKHLVDRAFNTPIMEKGGCNT